MSAPRIVVDVENGVAPWRQVRDQLVLLISGGVLPIGARLPTIRQLAADLGLAAGTVARAYRELETGGVLTTGRRQGTVVAALPSNAPDPLAAAAAEFVAVARSLGVSEGEALDAVRANYCAE
ncbi:GntR family transcriptional regulator [Nocardia sp. NRRL S-836]|uniref:GntR family transcriptional regulator n=1 Tax=Nocardia sp. NRRL S-836 TaxID=1519492 RepID=UPI0006AFC604|nr:GntR family transcriptional regulator [Nocardia sp. NRRL S-836]